MKNTCNLLWWKIVPKYLSSFFNKSEDACMRPSDFDHEYAATHLKSGFQKCVYLRIMCWTVLNWSFSEDKAKKQDIYLVRPKLLENQKMEQ